MDHDESIPHIFHHLWTSGDGMPEPVLAMRQTWIDRHPDWEFRIWRPDNLTWLRNQKLFDRAKSYAQKADIARYEVIHRFGGVYLDTDMECLRTLGPLLEGYDFFSARDVGGTISIGIFGATPFHPIMREMIERLPASCFVHPHEDFSLATGPSLLDRTIRDGRWEERRSVRIYPAAYFYPYAGWERWRRHEEFPRAYAVHHWDHSWKDQVGVRASLVNLLPQEGEPMLPSARALWREASSRGTTLTKKNLRKLVYPAYRFTKEVAHRVMPASEGPRGIPWGPGEVLVKAPFGSRLLCPTDDLSIAPELALTGSHDYPFVRFLKQRLHPGMTFVDVGAGIGLFTILGAARVGPGGRVFAYECDPELIGFVRCNAKMNWFDDRVRVIPKAAHRDDETRFLVPGERNVVGSLTPFVDLERQADDLQGSEVACERLDAGLEGVPYIDLLKIDVEGGEAAVLDGAAKLFDEGRIGAISLEYRQNVLREDMWEEMEKALTSLVQERGATLHVPGDPRRLQIDQVLTVFDYRQLLIRFPGASIEP